ncbi:LysM domain-containing protein [Sulfitobacter sp. PS-8MA]|uniref:LysM domain-containing protein n=1 Tax=Sulfitobacter sp. PS-8MA TaxID=3237707 RepID=UPI0034C65F09
MTQSRKFILSALSATALTGLASAASAQSACGNSYQIQYGDTLHKVSQQCRVSLSRIMDLNPQIGDVRDIEVGTRIALEGSASGGTSDDTTRSTANAQGTYRVEQGDTPYAIASALGISLFELLNENEDLDPLRMAVGDVLEVPQQNERQGSIRVTPTEAEVGSEVTLIARNLRPNDWVTVGVGETSSEWRALREVQVAADGELRTEVRVPEWAEPQDYLTFVVDTDRGYTYKSGDFTVAGSADASQEIALEGRVNEGVECHTLTTPDGDVWAIVSDDIPFTEGEYVEVEGERADMSICQQGLGTVEVAELDEVNR